MPVPIQTAKQISPLRRAFGLFGGLRLKLDETVVPVAIIEDLAPDEWQWAFMADVRGAAGAGAHHIWSLENPAGSGRVAEFGKLVCSLNAGMEYRLTVASPVYVPGTLVGSEWQNLNATYGVYSPGLSQNPSVRLRHTAAAAAPTGANVFDFYRSAAHTEQFEFHVVLNPGQSVVLWQMIDNLSGYVAFQWRERAVSPAG